MSKVLVNGIIKYDDIKVITGGLHDNVLVYNESNHTTQFDLSYVKIAEICQNKYYGKFFTLITKGYHKGKYVLDMGKETESIIVSDDQFIGAEIYNDKLLLRPYFNKFNNDNYKEFVEQNNSLLASIDVFNVSNKGKLHILDTVNIISNNSAEMLLYGIGEDNGYITSSCMFVTYLNLPTKVYNNKLVSVICESNYIFDIFEVGIDSFNVHLYNNLNEKEMYPSTHKYAEDLSRSSVETIGIIKTSLD